MERRIQFYQAMWIKDDKYMRKDLTFLNSFLTKLPMIKTADDTFNIYVEPFNNEVLIKEHADKSFWKISKIRKTDLPLKVNMKDMKSSPLDLKENEGLQEPSHFIVFNGAFIGAELNFNAPRVATTLYREINKYLELNSSEIADSIEINPIFREDAYKKIDKMSEISSVTIKVATNYLKTLNRIPDQRDYSFSKMFSSHEAVEDMFLGLQFYLGRGRKPRPKKAFEKIITGLRTLFNQPDCFDNIEVAKVRGRQFGVDSLEVVDLLEDSLMVRREVTKLDEKTKAVDPIDMYQKILDSHKLLKTEIDKYSSPITG
jgi:hypothetical protein